MERRDFHRSETGADFLGGKQTSGFAFRIHEVSANFPSHDIRGEVGEIVLVVGFVSRDDELEFPSFPSHAIQCVRDEALVGEVRKGSVDDDELRPPAAERLARDIADVLS